MKFIALFLLAGASGVAQSVTLTLPSVTAAPGATAYLNLQLKTVSGPAPASLEWAINAPTPEVQRIKVTLGPAAAAASKLLSCSGNRCVLAGLNSSAIGNGTVAVLAVQLSASAQGNLAIQFSYARAASAGAVGLSVGVGNGVVAVSSSLQTAFHGGAIAGLTDAIRSINQDLLKIWKNAARAHKSVNIMVDIVTSDPTLSASANSETCSESGSSPQRHGLTFRRGNTGLSARRRARRRYRPAPETLIHKDLYVACRTGYQRLSEALNPQPRSPNDEVMPRRTTSPVVSTPTLAAPHRRNLCAV